MGMEVLLSALLFLALVLTSGFFSGSETALFSLGHVQLLRLEEEGHPKARLIRSLLERPRRLIATIFIGNELVNIGASAILATATARLMAGQPHWLVTAVSTAVSVTLILFIGEITPKNLAVRVVERWSAVAARPLWLLAIVMAPLRILIEKIADLVVKVLGKRVPPPASGQVSEAEFLTMVDAVKDEGELDASEQELIHRVFEFGDRRVTEVMTPVDRVLALSAHLSVNRVLQEVRSNIYSRIPIYHGSKDRIAGILYAKDLFKVAYKLGHRAPRLQEMLHPAYFVPRNTKCAQLFREFRRRRTHLAIVVDEYGHFVGLVTMEDLLEELFGEIRDEKELPSPTGELRIPEDDAKPEPGGAP